MQGAESGPYTAGDLDVTELAPVPLKAGTPPRCDWMATFMPSGPVDSWEVGVTVRVKHASHRNKMVSLVG